MIESGETGLRTRINNGREEIFDPVRKKFVALTPEEGVRQYFIRFLVDRKNVPVSLVAVETAIKYNRLAKRCDIVIYRRDGKPALIVECKAPDIEITEDVFQQIAMYNFSLKVRYLVITNGKATYACYIDYEKGTLSYLQDVPDFETMNN